MSEQFSEIRDHFLAALERDGLEAQLQYAAEHCAGDPKLHRELEEMLRAHHQPEGFLASKAAATQVLESVLERPGVQIGPYKLMEQIGEGGMGLVFVAEQHQPVRRKVALKVIKPGMDTRDCLARFEAERQALALMDHPNIARVLDAGATASGRPYFVMELVKGVPITQHCDDNRLSPRERLELFTDVCHAVQHAHQKGIIHRDIKPSNVLVTSHDGQPVVKVIDFGVAKAIGQQLTERTIYTAMSQMVGTPLYMSPEQAGMSGLDIDTRTDIYSLGVLLYELLTGTTPFDKDRLRLAAYDEMRRIIREEEPQKPSTRISSTDAAPSIAAQRNTEPAKLSKLVRGELDWIVMKALEKDRNRRYETANGLVRDIEHYLHDEPVQACPPSRAYRMKKFLRRNKGAALATSLVFAALVVGMIATGWQARRAWVAEKKALQERDAKDLSLKSEQQARAEAVRASEQTLEALRAMTDAAMSRHIGRQVQLSEHDREFFNQILNLYERLAAVQGSSRESRALRTEGHVRMGIIRYRMRDTQGALAACTEARGQLKQLIADFPAEPDYRSWLAKCYGVLIQILTTQGRFAEAESESQEAIALCEKLVVDFPNVAKYSEHLGASHASLGSALNGLGKWAAAADAYRRAAELYEQLAEIRPATPDSRNQLVLCRVNIGLALSTLGDPAGAEAEIRKALSLATKLTADETDVPDYRGRLSTCHRHLGGLLRMAGKLADAELELRQALALEKALADEFPAVPTYRENLAKAHTALGELLVVDLDRAVDAEIELREALALQNLLVRDFPAIPAYRVQLAKTNSRLGLALEKQKRLDEAIAAHQRAVELDPGWVYSGLIRALTRAGRLDQAVVEHEERLRSDPYAIGSHHFLALAHFQQRRWKEAAHHFSRLLELKPSYSEVRASLALAYVKLEQWEEAVAQYSRLVEEKPLNASTHNELAWLLATCPDSSIRDPARAVELGKRAVELAPRADKHLKTLGVAQYRAGDWKAAIEALEKSMELGKGGDSTDGFFLAMAYWQLGNKQQARKWYDQAIEWMEKNAKDSDELPRVRQEAARLLELE